MIISVASGKGGTGKTTVAVNLALSLAAKEKVQFLDCDAEEPNAHIFLKPVIQSTAKVFIPVPEVDKSKCTYCGRCGEVCAYNAITVFPGIGKGGGSVLVLPALCHGCGSCAYFCPSCAIKEVNKEIGEITAGSAGRIGFVQGSLNIGEAMAPPVIREIKRRIDNSQIVILDAPPGTSCPVVATVKTSDFCLLVTEPTPFGLNDLKIAVELIRKLHIPFGVIINRSDLGNDETDVYCQNEAIPVLMRIPFEKGIAMAYSKGESLIKAFPEYQNRFFQLFENIKRNTGKFE